MPNAVWPIIRAPARPCSRSPEHGHGFDVPLLLTTLQQRFGFTHLLGPHLTPHGCLFHLAHHDGLQSNAADGGLKPPPERATPKGQQSFISHRAPTPTELHLPHESSFIVHDARPGKVVFQLVSAHVMASPGSRAWWRSAAAMLFQPPAFGEDGIGGCGPGSGKVVSQLPSQPLRSHPPHTPRRSHHHVFPSHSVNSRPFRHPGFHDRLRAETNVP